jgi:aryl carrier-like protein
MKETIIGIMREIAAESGNELVQELDETTVLLESGLDSLGFAILVARLEEELGYDPFSMMEEPVYPRKLGEFVDIYRKYAR